MITDIMGLTMVHGAGRPHNHTACLMSAARILSGEATAADHRNDACSRVSPEIRRFAIGTNDWRGWASDDERTRFLLPLVPAVLDTVASSDMVQRRLWILADVAVRVFTTIALKAKTDASYIKHDEARAKMLLDHARRTRLCDEIVDRPSAKRARDICCVVATVPSAIAANAAQSAIDGLSSTAAYAIDTAGSAHDAAVLADYTTNDTASAGARAIRRIAIRDALVDTLVRVCAIRDTDTVSPQ